MALSNQAPQQSSQTPSETGSRPERRNPGVWGWLLLALMLVFAFFFVRTLRRIGADVARLGRQTEEMNRRLAEAEHRSHALAQQATQAAENAEAAAQQRDQAEAARAQSQNQARQAQQQAATAQQEAKQAEQKAEQYRQQREQELARLQQVLGQIAETRRTAMGLVMTLGSNSIRFDFDKSDIKPQYRETLSRIAGVLMTVRGYSIYVYGYTDDIGTQEYNLKLSERRAQAVRDYLVQAGLDPKIITTKGYGESDPRVPGDSPEARAKNRRVEIGLVDTTLHFEGPAN